VAIALLACLLSAIFVLAFFVYLSSFSPFGIFVSVTFSELNSAPDFWLGKNVCISGILTCGFLSTPEDVPPYRCMLTDFNKSASIGIQWRKVDYGYSGKNVTVSGTFREGKTGPLIERTVYYVEAERIVPF
jgi:hypothetical protein